MKILTLFSYLTLLLVVDSIAANKQEPSGRVVYGYVFNASIESGSSKNTLKEQEVVLYSYVDGKASEGTRPHTVTDANGRYEFEAVAIGKRFAYYPVVVYQGVEYSGKIVTLNSDTLQQRSDVFAFESTRSDSNIIVDTHHIIMESGTGTLNVREFYLFSNKGLSTYLGRAPSGSSGKNIVLQMEVPETATKMQFGGNLMKCCAVVKDNHIFDTMELRPGTRPIVVNYLLPYKGKKASLIKKITHPTSEIDVFLPEGAGALSAAGFTAQLPFELTGQRYQRYRAADLQKGSTLTLMISGLAAPPIDWRWPATLAVVFLFIGGFFIYRWQKSKRTVGEPSYEKRANNERQRLLDQIVQLDNAFEAGAMNETTYFDVRERLKELILALDADNGCLSEDDTNRGKPKLEDGHYENR